jgi:hypothetical protein
MKLYIAVLLLFVGPQSAPDVTHDQKQEIQTLIRSFVKVANDDGDLSVFLSPNKTPSEVARQKEIIRRPFAEMRISGYVPESDIELKGTDRASLFAYVDWKTLHESAAGNVTLHFEKVAGRWYFSDFDFVFFPWFLVFGALGALLVYGIALAFFYFHLQRKMPDRPREKMKWLAVFALPFIGFIVYLVLNPWKKYPPRTSQPSS